MSGRSTSRSERGGSSSTDPPRRPVLDPSVAGDPVDRKAAAGGVDDHPHHPVVERDVAVVGGGGGDRVAQLGGTHGRPAEAGGLGRPGQHHLSGGLVDPDAHRGVGAGPQAGVEVLLDRGDGHVVALLAAERDGDVDPRLVLGHRHVVDPRAGVDLAAARQHADDRPYGGGVEGERSHARGDAEGGGGRRQGLGVRRRRVAGDHHLHQAAAGVPEGFTTYWPGSARLRERAASASSASPEATAAASA